MEIKTDKEAIEAIGAACAHLGWNICIPGKGKDEVPGMVIGTNAYISSILDTDDDEPETLESLGNPKVGL